MQIRFLIDEETENRFKDYIVQDMGITLLFEFDGEYDSYTVIHDFQNPLVPGWYKVWLCKEGIRDFDIIDNHVCGLDTTISYMIEFSRTWVFHEEKRVLGGRLWVSTSYYNDEDEKVKKSEDFVNLYKRLAGWIRKNTKRRTFIDGHGVEWTEYITDPILALLEKEGYHFY